MTCTVQIQPRKKLCWKIQITTVPMRYDELSMINIAAGSPKDHADQDSPHKYLHNLRANR